MEVMNERSALTRILRKREDPVLIKGQGCYADDAVLRAPLQVAFVRSAEVGMISDIDTNDADAMPGVRGVHVAKNVAHLGALSVNEVIPITELPPYLILNGPQVRAVGQPVAAVIAETMAQAQDGAEQVLVEIEPVPLDGKEIARQRWQAGDVEAAFAAAAHVVTCEIQHARLAPSPMEPRSIAVAYDTLTDHVTIWHSTQTPHRTRSELASILSVDPTRIRVIAQHVGGAFGMKASLYPEEVFTVWAAFEYRRDLKWTATRSEEFLSGLHGRGIITRGALALDGEGQFLALKAQVTAPIGPWMPNSALVPAWNAARILPSGYKVAAVDLHTTATQAGLGPTGIYRGAGRPEANCLMERLVDKAARVLGRDPIELRQMNLLKAAELPHTTATGDILDSGNYARSLDLLSQHAGYAGLMARREQRRAKGEAVGVGIAFCVEPSGSGWESARVTLNPNGSVLVASGSSSQGHGRETSYAQIAAQVLQISPKQIAVICGDTDTAPEGIGALASRATAIGGSAVFEACQRIKALRKAGETAPITADVRYENKGQAWGYGAYLVMLSIDKCTGEPRIEYAACVDDAGTLIRPDLVRDQIIGGFAQGVGEALMEQVVHDADGQLLSGSFMDYAMPRASDVPHLDMHETQSPSPMNLLGAKGVGEAGTIGAPAAILNAAIDALAPFGVTDLTLPLTPATLWQALQDALGEKQ